VLCSSDWSALLSRTLDSQRPLSSCVSTRLGRATPVAPNSGLPVSEELSPASWKLAGRAWGNRAAFGERLHVVQRAGKLRSPRLNVLLPGGIVGQHGVVEDQRVNQL
jgi:hypothetical protein